MILIVSKVKIEINCVSAKTYEQYRRFGKLNMKNIILFLGEKSLATCRKKIYLSGFFQLASFSSH